MAAWPVDHLVLLIARGLAWAGRSLMFFAEGTVARMPGLLPFYMGAFVTAAKASVPMVPIALHIFKELARIG